MSALLRRSISVGFQTAAQVRRVYRMIRRPITVGVRALVINGDDVLLVRQHGARYWALPGGAAARGETLRAAAEREAREETGLPVIGERLLGMYTTLHEGMTNHVAVFVCRPVDREARPRIGRLDLEIAEAQYWPIGALPETAHSMVRKRLTEHESGVYGIDGAF